MLKNHFFLFLISATLLSGCKSILSPIEDDFKPSLSLDELSTPQTALNTTNGNSLEDKFTQEVEALIKTKEEDLSSYYENYLDSLKLKLKDSGSIKIKGYEDFLVNILSDQIKNDTIYLANLVTKTETKGTPLSFQYTGLKNDNFYFEIECLKNNSLSELIFGGIDIEFVEGDQVRYKYFDLKKKDKIKGSFKVINDNPIIFNVTKKGYSKSALKVKVKKTLGSNLIVERVIDSLEENHLVIKEVSDTIYHLIDEKQYNLAPYLDITNPHKLKIPLVIDNLENLLGWGYWLGISKSDIDNYSQLYELIFDEPLKLFAKSELIKTSSKFTLPKTLNENLKIDFKNNSNDYISLNSSISYSFFKTDSLSNPLKGELRITNLSKLYDYMITLKTVGVNIVKSKVQEEETTYKLNEYINISVIK
ncbi:MAG: hypothetical protein CMB82_03975 [Flammeovirgaceae bacterium]|nr:hypothetical protein [Flammeovirgaceae bacterium]|tara:strand:+ start:969 stop:2228 length:1260 start_codon:yes stop_codon:yes gene_type:complete